MKTRVLHVIDSLDLGGAQVVVENLVRHGDRAKFEMEVAALHGRGVFWERIAQLGVPVHSLSPWKWLPLYVPRLLGRFLFGHYDIVHCHLLGANVIAKPLTALSGVRVRVNHDHCNDKSTLSAPARVLDRWANRLSSHVIAVSESTRADLIAHGGLTAREVTTVHNGLDLVAYQPRPQERAAARAQFGLPEEAFVVGGLGRLAHQKNFALFIEVAAKVCVRHPHVHFVIAGTGEEEGALRAQIAGLHLGGRVHLLGMVARTAELYPALDALLLTSRFEGLPMTILEAMACGVPIVASDLDGMREILGDGENAALVAATDVEGFAGRVAQIILEPALAGMWAGAALALVRERYSAEEMARAVEGIYRRVLAV
jgi:glycosyltransferase involved in cell wall biosynthesis